MFIVLLFMFCFVIHKCSLLAHSFFKRILVVTQMKANIAAGMKFLRLLTLFARAKGFLRRKHLMEILMMKMVNYAIWKNSKGLKLHQIL